MARIARVVLPGYPHPVTQRGNRRQRACKSGFAGERLDVVRHQCPFDWHRRCSGMRGTDAGDGP
ncbi:MAG: hypothetical protein U9P00_14100 [Pseudomonadota bacterium]|nr:hypothetical protein [Pseudomonadota bacterium]